MGCLTPLPGLGTQPLEVPHTPASRVQGCPPARGSAPGLIPPTPDIYPARVPPRASHTRRRPPPPHPYLSSRKPNGADQGPVTVTQLIQFCPTYPLLLGFVGPEGGDPLRGGAWSSQGPASALGLRLHVRARCGPLVAELSDCRSWGPQLNKLLPSSRRKVWGCGGCFGERAGFPFLTTSP